mmetsp:Transcript_17993/g.46492  ORF Transcript_17993/g.46492 Transcript_17993/m.46492 type:complete len:215 (-) Transcript_17993:400-1044(-)
MRRGRWLTRRRCVHGRLGHYSHDFSLTEEAACADRVVPCRAHSLQVGHTADLGGHRHKRPSRRSPACTAGDGLGRICCDVCCDGLQHARAERARVTGVVPRATARAEHGGAAVGRVVRGARGYAPTPTTLALALARVRVRVRTAWQAHERRAGEERAGGERVGQRRHECMPAGRSGVASRPAQREIERVAEALRRHPAARQLVQLRVQRCQHHG